MSHTQEYQEAGERVQNTVAFSNCRCVQLTRNREMGSPKRARAYSSAQQCHPLVRQRGGMPQSRSGSFSASRSWTVIVEPLSCVLFRLYAIIFAHHGANSPLDSTCSEMGSFKGRKARRPKESVSILIKNTMCNSPIRYSALSTWRRLRRTTC